MSRMLGQRWERIAERWLSSRQVKVLERNFTCRAGEIDLIALDGEYIAFVEVKFRSSSNFGWAAEHVTRSKQVKILRAAKNYLKYHAHSPTQVFRFDVISIDRAGNTTDVRWIKDAFRAFESSGTRFD